VILNHERFSRNSKRLPGIADKIAKIAVSIAAMLKLVPGNDVPRSIIAIGDNCHTISLHIRPAKEPEAGVVATCHEATESLITRYWIHDKRHVFSNEYAGRRSGVSTDIKTRIAVLCEACEIFGIGGDFDRLTTTITGNPIPAYIAERIALNIDSANRECASSGFSNVIKFIIMWSHQTSPQ